MKRGYLIIISAYFFVMSVHAQDFIWAKHFNSQIARPSKVKLDSEGNVYVVGYFTNSMSFNSNSIISTLTSVGNYDIFIIKFDTQGNYIWGRSFGNTNDDMAQSIYLDENYVYITGNFYGTVDFDSSNNVASLTSGFNADIFVLKLDFNGSYVWAKKMTGQRAKIGNDISVDLLGNVFIVGNFEGIVDFDPSSNVSNLISSESFTDVFVCKLDSFGNYLWANQIGSDDLHNDFGKGIILDSQGNVYFTGEFRGIVDFDSSTNVANLITNGVNNTFVCKLDSNGNYVWAKSFVSTGKSGGVDIAIDSFEQIYTIGYLRSTVDFDPGLSVFNLTATGTSDTFISKLDSNGNFVWAKRMGGSNSVIPSGITLDNGDNLYLTGYFDGSVNFDLSQNIVNISTNGEIDVFISKLDSFGNYLWAKKVGGVNRNVGMSIDIDNQNNIFTSGYFEGVMDFDPSDDFFNLTAGVNQSNGFLCKWSQCVEPSILSQPIPIASCLGSSVSFNVNAIGTNLNYQWMKNGVNINGANLSNFILNDVSSNSLGDYLCKISNNCGSVFSNVASLSLLPNLPSISYLDVESSYQIGSQIDNVSPNLVGNVFNTSQNLFSIVDYNVYYEPSDVEVDENSSLFVSLSNRVKKVAANGVVTEIMPWTDVPNSLAKDSQGNIYVSQTSTSTIMKISTNGIIIPFGSGFINPTAVAVDSFDNVYVADTDFTFYDNSIVKKIALDGTITTIGNGFKYPTGIAVDSFGNVFVADSYYETKLYKIDTNGLKSVFASGFWAPYGLAIDKFNNVILSSYGDNAVFKITPSGSVSVVLNNDLSNPKGVCVDSYGDIYVADSRSFTVKKIKLGTTFSIFPNLPLGLTLDPLTGIISGVPTQQTATTIYTITLQNNCFANSTTITFATTLPCEEHTSDNQIIASCGSYTWPLTNQTYTSSGTYSYINGCNTTNLNLTISCNSILNLKLFIEGYYDIIHHEMRPVKKNQNIGNSTNYVDDIVIELRDTNNILVDSTNAILLKDGTVVCAFNSLLDGSYYVVVKHRNSIDTWSSNPVLFNQDQGVVDYDFTTDSNKAFGFNLKLLEQNVNAIFSGDINQDGNVDNTDYSILESDLNNFTTGYSSSDLNGDGNVDNTDYSIFETNSNNFIFKITPFN